MLMRKETNSLCKEQEGKNEHLLRSLPKTESKEGKTPS